MLPEYERNVYTEYLPPEQRKDPQLLFVNNPKVQDGVRNLQEVSCNNSFQDCLDLVSYEVLEVEAMEETIAGIEVLESIIYFIQTQNARWTKSFSVIRLNLQV